MKKTILKTTLMVFLALLICKMSAFLQEIVVAAKLGATATGDAFNMVFGIQQTIYPTLSFLLIREAFGMLHLSIMKTTILANIHIFHIF